MRIDEQITVVVTTSPIPSHPSTAIIDQTIASVRHWLPSSPIYIVADGVRPEQAGGEIESNYRRFVNGLHCDENVDAWWLDEFMHQAGAVKKVLPCVDTPLILFMEHDTPLVTDEPIDWEEIVARLLDESFNLVRFSHEAAVLPEHEYLMEPRMGDFIPTRQWSQRPHVARTDFYRMMLPLIPDTARTMIEDALYTYVVNAQWNAYRLAIYAPPGNIKRSLHLDGRAGAEKFEMRYV